MPQLTGKDIIALVLIIGAFVLRALGDVAFTDWIIIGIGASYFGADVFTRRRGPKP